MASVRIGGQGADLSLGMASPAAGAVAVRAKRQDTTQALLLFVPLFYASLFNQLRPLGSAPLLLAAGAMIYVGLTSARRYMQPILLLYAALALLYTGLSYTGVLHAGLTLLFVPAAIPRQSAYALLLPFAVAGFALYHQGVWQGKRGFVLLETCTLGMTLTFKLFSLVVPIQDSLTGELYRDYSGIFQMVDPVALLAFILVRRTVQSPWATHRTKIVVAVLLLVTSNSAQANIAMGVLVPLLLVPAARRLTTVLFLLTLLAIPIIAWPYAQQIWTADPNTGIRLYFWHDVLQRVWESNGVGVGFGTETIRPYYALEASDVSLADVSDPSFIFTGAHNAFMDALYRMGVPGFLLLATFVVRLFGKVLRGPAALAGVMDLWTICAVFTVMMVNVALVSFNFFFGVTFFLGWLVFRTSQVPAVIGHHPSPLELRRRDGGAQYGAPPVASWRRADGSKTDRSGIGHPLP